MRPEIAAPIDQATLAKWESGETAVRVQDLEMLAEVYGVTTDRLFYQPGDERTPELMRRAFDVLKLANPADVEDWLRLGERLKGANVSTKNN